MGTDIPKEEILNSILSGEKTMNELLVMFKAKEKELRAQYTPLQQTSFRAGKTTAHASLTKSGIILTFENDTEKQKYFKSLTEN